MREMRLAKREVTSPDRQRAVVDACQVLRIGASDDEGMFIVPVNFGYDWDMRADGTVALAFYLHSAREGRKADAFMQGGATGTRVAVELDSDRGTITGDYACAYSRSYVSLMGTGRIRPVTDERERIHAIERIMAHAAPEAPRSFAPEALARVALFRINVAHFTVKERAPKR